MSEDESRPEWKKQLAGGFAHMTAPFALHPADKIRAKAALKLAQEAGITKQEFMAAARSHLERAQGWPTDIDKQLSLVEKFVGGKLAAIEILH